MKTTVLVWALALGACAGGKAPVTDEPDFTGEDIKADLTKSSKFVGMVDGTGALAFAYTKTPHYRTVGFTAQAGVQADIWVAPHKNGDPVTWLLDCKHKIIAKNDDADDTTVASHLSLTLPASNGYYYVVVRDYYWDPASFLATVHTFATGNAGAAEHAYDTLVGSGADASALVVDRAALPAAARAEWDAWAAKFAAPTAYALPVGSGTVYALTDGQEELYFVTLYSASGTKLAHGYSGDGGPEVTDWSGHSPYDPSLM